MENIVDIYESYDVAEICNAEGTDNSSEDSTLATGSEYTTSNEVDVVSVNADESEHIPPKTDEMSVCRTDESTEHSLVGNGGAESCGSIGTANPNMTESKIVESCSSTDTTHTPCMDSAESNIYERTYVYNPPFKSKEDMLPYEQKPNFEDENGIKDPFGYYALRHNGGELSNEDFIEKPYLPENFSEEQLQNVCNQMCDVLDIRHLPVFVTDYVANAQSSTLAGPFRFTLIDDTLSFNPDYMQECVDHLGTTDIVLSDAAHEIGHAMASKYCGKLSTYTNEKVADFISGFLNCKMGVDIDVARQWFQWHYDPEGVNNYPVSEERWDIESAGYYFAKRAGTNDLKEALKDPEFLKLIMDYKNESLFSLSVDQWVKMHLEGCGYSDVARNLFSNIQKYLLLERY